MDRLGICVTAWIDRRIDRFGAVVADRLLEKSGMNEVGDMFGAFLLGLNGELQQFSKGD